MWTIPVMTLLATTASSSTHMMHRLTINSITPILSKPSNSSNIEVQYTNTIPAFRLPGSASMANSIRQLHKHSIRPCRNIRNTHTIHHRC